MRGHTHLIVSGTIGYLLFPEIGLIGAGAAAMGGLLPDLDHPGSMLGRRAPIFSALADHHRGWFHTLVGAAAFTLVAAVINPAAAIGVATGYLSHLALDTLNPSGIMWLWPIRRERIHILNIRSGSFGDVLISCLCVLYLIGKVWYS